MAMKAFKYNGTSSASFGLFVNNISNYGSPARNVEKIAVPYRNGDVAIDMGTYENIMVTYEVSLLQRTAENIQAIAEWLLSAKGYQRLEDDWHPDEYRSALCYSPIEWIVTFLTRYGKATITFDCKPQRFLKSGENLVTFYTTGTQVNIQNPTAFPSKPLIMFYGNGSLTVNGYEMTITNNTDMRIYIDCESMECYRGQTSMNNYVTVEEFPVLKGGDNTITGDNLNDLQIIPRWWRL